jgi:hypothetical protein
MLHPIVGEEQPGTDNADIRLCRGDQSLNPSRKRLGVIIEVNQPPPGRGASTLIARYRKSKISLVAYDPHRGELCQDFLRVIRRTVVDDDDFTAPIESSVEACQTTSRELSLIEDGNDN